MPRRKKIKRKSTFKYPIAVIGNNIYSFLLKQMMGDNCVVISNKQPFYMYSFDYLIPKTDIVERFFVFNEIPYRIAKITIGSVARVKRMNKFNEIVKQYISIPFLIEEDPFEVEFIIPDDITSSKYLIDKEIEEIEIKDKKFRIILDDRVYEVEKIINTLFLHDFLNLIPSLKYMKDFFKVNSYKRVTYHVVDIYNYDQKFNSYNIVFEYGNYEFDVYRACGFIVLADLIISPNEWKWSTKYRIVEKQPHYLFNKEYKKEKLIDGIYLEGRYAQIRNYLNFDDFILSITTKFENYSKYLNENFEEVESEEN